MAEIQPSVVLGADPLFQPHTGIGNYTRSLARNLLALELVKQLTLYANGMVLADSMLTSLPDTPDGCSTSRGANGVRRGRNRLSEVRSFLASRSWAVSAYEKVMPLVDRARLYPYRGAVFHSPNYLVPRFDGATVTTFHDLSIQRFPHFHPQARVRLLHKSMADAAERSTHIITDSELVRREVIDYYTLSPDQVTAIPLAADSRFRPRSPADCAAILAPLGLEHRGFLLFSGTIEPRKNIRRICSAYKSLRIRNSLHLPIVFVGGEGWQSAEEHNDIQELVAKGWALYLGFVEENVLTTLFSAARALIYPSIYEGFGLPVVEAKHSATPVVTSKGSPMAEYTDARDCLVNPLDADAIAEAIEAVLDSRSLSTQQDHSAAFSELSWAETARRTASIYGRLAV